MTVFANELVPGDPIAPRKFTVSPVVNQQRLFAQEDFHLRYLPCPGGAPEMVHPALVLQMLANTSSPSYRVPVNVGPVLAEAETMFMRPLRVGVEYVTTWQIVRAYLKRGRQYQEILAQITDTEGGLAVKRTLHITYVEQPA